LNKYKVFGDMMFDFYIDVEAENAEAAWDIAANAQLPEWTRITGREAVEVHFVEELKEDTSDLLEDGYPSISNDILVMDKSDISE